MEPSTTSARRTWLIWGGVAVAIVLAMWIPRLLSSGDPAAVDGPAPAASQPAPPMPAAAQAKFTSSVDLEQAGRLQEALASAEEAVANGGGRDAELQASKLSIQLGQLDRAEELLAALVTKDPADASAQYNLALVAHRRGLYNKARSGYLAAVRADAEMAQARYNLAVLTFERGVVDEARHHAERYAELRPGTPEAKTLQAMVAGVAKK